MITIKTATFTTQRGSCLGFYGLRMIAVRNQPARLPAADEGVKVSKPGQMKSLVVATSGDLLPVKPGEEVCGGSVDDLIPGLVA